ncbi:MAG: rod shape-determining protein RodA [Bacteroidetes bacterium]|nr:rod shape-determining protein RodA [Bacteroidota bacterium]PHX82458.1 MAG: rod shape-determining protein RodA [Flavobacteriales bacterium]
MREKSNSLFYNIDWITVAIYFILILIGWMNIYSAVYDEASSTIFNLSRLESKQFIFILIAIVLAFSIIIIDASFFTATAYILFAGIILLNIVVCFLGTDIRGSHSWFKFGSFSFQPAEFAKWATALAIAKYLSGVAKKEWRTKLLVTIGFIFIPIAVIVVLQNETGCALVFAAFIIVMYREGLVQGIFLFFGLLVVLSIIIGLKYPGFIIGVAVVLLLIAAFRLMLVRRTVKQFLLTAIIVSLFSGLYLVAPKVMEKLPEHQTGRIKSWLGLPVSRAMQDRFGYNTKQSMIAIGSGGWAGKGYLQGTQTKYRFVPEQETDFIFCTVGEEWGFVGTAFIILLYLILISRLIIMSERQRSDFTRIYGYGVAAIFFIHLVVNIGMTIGLLPVIGIPLPFFSYGGSSLISFTILLFIFVKLDSQRLLILR